MTSCSQSSIHAEEPIAGTAVQHTWRWLGLEVRGRWESRALQATPLPPEVRAQLDAFAALPGTRIQLLKGRERSGPLRVFYADTTPGAQRVHAFELSRYTELLDLGIGIVQVNRRRL